MELESAATQTARRTWSERFERSSIGRYLISLAVVLVLCAEVVSHLPPSALQRALDQPADQLGRMLATEQDWGVFAPDPRSTSVRFEARVTLSDGSSITWTVPEGPPIGANLRYYRWRKWFTRLRLDHYEAMWEPTASWIASLYGDESSPPVVEVELVRRFRDNVLTGAQPPWEEFTFYTLHLEEG